MGVLELAKEAARRIAAEARTRVGKHVSLQNPRTLFLSDWALTRALEMLGKQYAPDAELRVEQQGSGHRVSGRAGGKSVSALLVLRTIGFRAGTLTLEVETPEGVELEARPLAGFYSASVARLLGGKWLGEKLFS